MKLRPLETVKYCWTSLQCETFGVFEHRLPLHVFAVLLLHVFSHGHLLAVAHLHRDVDPIPDAVDAVFPLGAVGTVEPNLQQGCQIAKFAA